jgi:hypothetical protein
LSQVVFVPPRAQAFVLDTEFGVIVLQPIQGDVAQDGEVLAGAVVTHARLILAEGHIQTPIQAVLDPPVPAHGAGKGGRIGADAADEEARLAASRPTKVLREASKVTSDQSVNVTFASKKIPRELKPM